MSTDETITLTPVALPDEVKGRVDRVVICRHSNFFTSGRRCFATGVNSCGQLGIGSDENTIPTPIELPVPVDDIISSHEVTVIQSGYTLLACGDNRNRQISANNTPHFATLTLLDLPGPVVIVIVDLKNVFIQLEDGAWVGRGRYDSRYFIPVPKADLINRCFLPGWTPVNDDHAEELNAMEDSDAVIVLPEKKHKQHNSLEGMVSINV